MMSRNTFPEPQPDSASYILAIYFVQPYPNLLTLHVLSAIKAYNGYHPCHRVLWINPAANITFLVITLESAGI